MSNDRLGGTAVIIGGGPAGLTAAFEFVTRTGIKPIVLEKDDVLGGLARTVTYKGNRMDIGGHRFFSKSDRVMSWWLDRLPLQRTSENTPATITYQRASKAIQTGPTGPDPNVEDRVMLLRHRKSRIYFTRQLFEYPLKLSPTTLLKLGYARTIKIALSYMRALLAPIKPENTLEQFFINKFGQELYRTFFKSYTEKVWGVPCNQIDAAWGAQRVKGLSIRKIITQALSKPFRSSNDLRQKKVETSIIENFMYPKYGPGQLWELVAEDVKKAGGTILKQFIVTGINVESNIIKSVECKCAATGEFKTISGNYFFSSMPIKDLIACLRTDVPKNVREVAEGLMYRDFIAVGILVDHLKLTDKQPGLISDNWIYIQEPDVRLGRLQIFNNWSPYLVKDPSKVWLGLEYFCTEGDDLWSLEDDSLVQLATSELCRLGIIYKDAVLDSTIVRMPKTYPGYFGTYTRLDEVQAFLDRYKNLFLVGRNGMHKYNNQDHAMLTAMTAVDNIIAGVESKENIWAVNTEQEYLEESNDST